MLIIIPKHPKGILNMWMWNSDYKFRPTLKEFWINHNNTMTNAMHICKMTPEEVYLKKCNWKF